MITIDTNVLLRYLLDDDKLQSKLASKLILSGEPVLITDVVLVESIWTLRGKRYSLEKESIFDGAYTAAPGAPSLNRLFRPENRRPESACRVQ